MFFLRFLLINFVCILLSATLNPLSLSAAGEESFSSSEPQQSISDAVPSGVDKNKYIINSEDSLNIQVWGQDDMKRSVEVTGAGNITFPPLGQIHASGLTISQLEDEIASQLRMAGLLNNPQVSVDVNQYGSLKAFIMGEVGKPGRYFLKGKIHILALISEAGGLTIDAGSTAIIIRNSAPGDAGSDQTGTLSGQDNIIKIDIDDVASGKNFNESFVLPGDTVQIPKAERFYVTGEIKKPGQFKWEKGISVRRALAMAGGPTAKGAPGRLTIQRLENGKEKDFSPRMTDLVQAGDILDIPDSFF